MTPHVTEWRDSKTPSLRMLWNIDCWAFPLELLFYSEVMALLFALAGLSTSAIILITDWSVDFFIVLGVEVVVTYLALVMTTYFLVKEEVREGELTHA